MYKYKIPIFVWERDFSDVIKYVHNRQVISPIQLSEVDSVKKLSKMRDGLLFSYLSKCDVQVLSPANQKTCSSRLSTNRHVVHFFKHLNLKFVR